MTDNASLPAVSWTRSRYGFAAFWAMSLVMGWFLLRLVFFIGFRPPGVGMGQVFAAFLSGFQRDVFAALLESLPLLFWFVIISNRAFASRWHRLLFGTASFVLCFAQIFLLFVEYFFFEEFRSRFNTVAVDYLLYPKEVFVNIWESYHVGVVLVVCLVFAVGWLLMAARWFSGMWTRPFAARSRFSYFATACAATALLGLTFDHKTAHVSADRTLNELANNGAVSFITAARTRNLDYTAFYKTLPPPEAYERARKLLTEPGSEFIEPPQTGADTNAAFSILRRVAGDPSRPRLNVVIFLEESLGSEFWGSLGRKKTLTPEMDKLAAEEGLLFTNIYA
ncbi:MAG TPA: hypothetical protein VLT36_15185, partial [Candidatus Dormibacteraeota bacterium]|nr:hypothetical protein [Candidatus Dormibacteraeota bacterium]